MLPHYEPLRNECLYCLDIGNDHTNEWTWVEIDRYPIEAPQYSEQIYISVIRCQWCQEFIYTRMEPFDLTTRNK